MIVTRGLVVGHDAPLATIADLRLEAGELTAIVGPNGIGKTTLLRTLAGSLRPHAGTVELDGAPVAGRPARARARVLGYVPTDDPTGESMPVREAVLQGRLAHRGALFAAPSPADERAVTDALDRMDLTAFAHRHTRTLSSGEAQRVWIAAALAQDAPHLFLDEPTARLDIRNAALLLDRLRTLAEAGRCVIAVLHDLNLAATFAHRVIVLGPGRTLAVGPPTEVMSPAILSQSYGTPIRVLCTDDGILIAPALQRGGSNGATG